MQSVIANTTSVSFINPRLEDRYVTYEPQNGYAPYRPQDNMLHVDLKHKKEMNLKWWKEIDSKCWKEVELKKLKPLRQPTTWLHHVS